MKRRIFVGSSSEGLPKAREICDLLQGFGETEAVLWTTVFEPGMLTFEALENMLIRCCAAVFVATPDDESVIRGNKVKTPRSNVMLEFGLVAGRIGRHSIALCLFGGVELPSDLKGLTYVEMEPKDPAALTEQYRLHAAKALQTWTSSLLATADLIARTEILHGYTGRWDFELRLDRWRGLAVAPPSYAYVKGAFDLVVFANGQAGRGFAHARVFFKLMNGAASGGELYQGEYRTAHEITSAFCSTDGSLEFASQAFAVEKMNATGQPPPELAGMDNAPEPWSSQWRLRPCAEPRTLAGQVCTDNVVMTQGSVKVMKS